MLVIKYLNAKGRFAHICFQTSTNLKRQNWKVNFLFFCFFFQLRLKFLKFNFFLTKRETGTKLEKSL